MRKFILITFLIFLITGTMFYLISVPRNMSRVTAVNGVLNLDREDFSKSLFGLNGEWEFYWEELYTPHDFINGKPSDGTLIHAPMSWTDAGYLLHSYATYRLIVKTNERELLMFIPNVNDAGIVWVNGERVYEAGRVSAVRSERKMGVKNSLFMFHPENGQFEIIITASNLGERAGGLVFTAMIGRSGLLLTDIVGRRVLICLFIGFAFAIFLYHIILFIYRRNEWIYFLFSINSLLMLRSIFDENSLAAFFIPQGLTIELYKLFLFLLLIQAVIVLLFSHSIFKIRFNIKLINVIYIAVFFISLLVAILPYGTINPQVNVIVVIPLLILCIRVLRQKRLRENQYNLLYLFSLFAFCFWVPVNRLLLEDAYMASIGPSLFLLLCQCFIFSVVYAQSKDAQKAAEDASIAKSRFLASMSHEIRTPMNAILGIAQIQLQDEDLSTKQHTAMEKIYSSGNSLLGIINDILDLSKIETGKMEINPLEYDIPSLINDTVQLNFVQIGTKPIKFILDLDEKLPSKLTGDELRIKQILNNLLSNAVKYTDTGYVKLSVSSQKQGVDVILRFVIEDSGQGMNKEDCEKLFSEYMRFNMGANREKEGTGLGLNIARSLIELMDGTIAVESEYGKGSTFTVTIKQKAVECQPIGSVISNRLKNFSFTGEKQCERLKIVREPMPYGNILVVDDVETNLYVAQGFLSPYKLNIDLAISGFETIDLIKAGKAYDVIFMDHMMPKMDGMETTKRLRSLGYDGVIIALTANALAGNKEMFMENGFDGFIPKPIDIRDLNLILNVYIRDKYPEEAQKFRAELVTVSAAPAVNPKMLEIFWHDAEKAVVTIKETLTEGNIQLFTTTVHAMKSALANIGEDEKSMAASALEEAGINKDLDFINANINSFLQTLEQLVIELTPAESKVFDDAITEDIVFLKEQLEIIIVACEVYDDSVAYAALDKLKEKKWKKETSTALEKIRNTLYLHSDFDEAAVQANNILGGFSSG